MVLTGLLHIVTAQAQRFHEGTLALLRDARHWPSPQAVVSPVRPTQTSLGLAVLVLHTHACPWLGQGSFLPLQWFPQCQSRLFCQGSDLTVLSTLFYGAWLPNVTQHNFQGWK